MIGGVACTVVTADASSIQCTIGDGPIGEHGVIVHVPGMGYASGNLNFTYTSDLSDINPKEGALGGMLFFSVKSLFCLTLSQMTNFTLFQTGRVWRQQFQI